MKDLTWPAVVLFVAVLAALVVIFGLSDDPNMRAQVLGYFDHIVPFVVGVGAGADLQRHLAAHAVSASLLEIDAEGAAIGAVLRRHLAEDPRDLVVMGAFGHSRVREFVLGGATQSLLDQPPVPVFFAH